MRIDQGPNPGSANLRRLPSPSEHAQRNREAIERIIAPIAPRLLMVASVSGQKAILAEQDGTVIDEEVPVVAGPVVAGDRVVRLPLPGRGRRDARPSYVAIGPVNAVRAAPQVTVGPAAGSGATATIAGLDGFCRVTVNTGTGPATGVLFTVRWAAPRPNATYGIWCSGRNVAGRTSVAGGIAQSGADTVQCPVGVAVAPPASTQLLYNVLLMDG